MTPGRYFIESISDRPTGNWGFVIVEKYEPYGKIKQIFYPDSDNTTVFVRSKQSKGGEWSSWEAISNFGCNTAADLASLLGGQGIARGVLVTLHANETSQSFSGYGLWCISNEQNDGGAILFTFQYATNSVTIISDPKSHHGTFWTINKSSAGQTFTITNLQGADCPLWLTNLTPKY